jgi:hypothetical protein
MFTEESSRSPLNFFGQILWDESDLGYGSVFDVTQQGARGTNSLYQGVSHHGEGLVVIARRAQHRQLDLGTQVQLPAEKPTCREPPSLLRVVHSWPRVVRPCLIS